MFVIPSGSMENTLEVQDRIVAQKVSGFQRGDAVVFRDRLDWLSPPIQDTNLVHEAPVGQKYVSVANSVCSRKIDLNGEMLPCS